MNIGLDIDGCLADFDSSMAALMTAVSYGACVPALPVTKWHWLEDYPKDVVDSAWRRITEDGVFWRGLKPLPDMAGCVNDINAAADAGHNIYFITARPGSYAKIQTEEWLEAQGVVSPTVLLAHGKGHAARGLELHRFVDDKPENLVDVLRACGTACAVRLLNKRYNQEFGHAYVSRVQTMRDIFAGVTYV